MRALVTAKEMQNLDENTTHVFHVPTEVLMEQAAMGFVTKLLNLFPCPQNVLIVCGNGNNGGDGIAIGRLLNQRNVKASVYFCEKDESKGSELFLLQKKIYKAYQYPIVENISEQDTYDVIIDAIFGIGLSRAISGEYFSIISVLNSMRGNKISVDISSGISATTGEVLGCAFKADYTITFSFEKLGQYLWPGAEYSGRILIADIGITKESSMNKKDRIVTLQSEDLKRLPQRIPFSNKGTYGKLLIIAGAPNMSGAAFLSAKAAYKSGCGLVKIFTHETNRIILQTGLPEAILSTYGDYALEEELLEQMKWADAIVIGPGMGCDANAERVFDFVLKNATVPIVLDADAINILAKEPERLLAPHMDIIITPHLKEMSRLIQNPISFIKTNLIELAQDFATKYNVICVLKDARTVTSIPYGQTYLNLSGNNGMATAGSGDVLSGIIGSLLAQSVMAEEAAPLGVFLHGLAGDAIVTKTGKHGMMAQDIISGLEIVWSKVEK